MLILAIESSAKPASVAVYRQDGGDGDCGNGNNNGNALLGQYFQNNGFSHSRTLMAMAEALLRGLDLTPSDIGLFAVASGPGSFTGVRIGVSAAKGLGLGLGVPVCGVSTLEAMAYQTVGAGIKNTPQTAADALICPVMDARRSQVYNALFRWDDGRLVRLREDRAISIEDLAVDLRGFGQPFMPLGDGADLLLLELGGDNSLTPLPPNPLIKYQTAHGVALAALHNKTMRAADLEPTYLRPSQAERIRLIHTEALH